MFNAPLRKDGNSRWRFPKTRQVQLASQPMEHCSTPFERLRGNHSHAALAEAAKENPIMYPLTLHTGRSPRPGTDPGKDPRALGARRRMVVLAAALILWLTGGAAHAQLVKNGAVTGTLVSESADIGGTVLTVPSDKAFVLTQVC